MSTSVSKKFEQLKADIGEMSLATASLGWDQSAEALVADPTNLGAKPIPKAEWMRAFVIAVGLSRVAPYLDPPVPGADPEGFVWLTWTQDDCRGLALELHRGFYKWTQRDGEQKRTHQSESLDDVGEAIQSVFRRPLSA
jgi:hypothetical protein